MSQDNPAVKRFNTDIPIDLDVELKRMIPHGTQSEVMRRLLIAFRDSFNEQGSLILHALLTGEAVLMKASDVHQMNDKKGYGDPPS